jgi:hypothetical protein
VVSGNDIFTEIVHLTEAQAIELHAMIVDYTQKHKCAQEDTKPWQIVYMAYNMELAEKNGGEA